MENQQVANIEPKKKRAERWKSTGSLFQRMMMVVVNLFSFLFY